MAGYIYDITNNYRVTFYIAGSVMLLNCTTVLLDPAWRALDRQRLGGQNGDDIGGDHLVTME